MEANNAQAPTGPAPLYASPWLAFFYLIREAWNASEDEARDDSDSA